MSLMVDEERKIELNEEEEMIKMVIELSVKEEE